MATIVYWDTCAYRSIISSKYKRPKHASSIEEFANYIAKLEISKGYTVAPSALVLWELISHLPNKEFLSINECDGNNFDSDYKSCFYACRFIQKQSLNTNGAKYLPFPQSDLANGINSVHSGAAKQEAVEMYEAVAYNISRYIASFYSVFKENANWRSEAPLIEVAKEMLLFKKRINDTIIDNLKQLKESISVSLDSFIANIEEIYTGILYTCVETNYIPKGEKLYFMHSIAYTFLKKWAQDTYENLGDICDIEKWAYKKKISNTLVDALLLAIMTNRQEDTQYIFVTMDESILYQYRNLNNSNHKIISLTDYLQDIGAIIQ